LKEQFVGLELLTDVALEGNRDQFGRVKIAWWKLMALSSFDSDDFHFFHLLLYINFFFFF